MSLSDEALETPICNFCGDNTYQLAVEGPDRLCGLPGYFRMVRCLRCGLLYLNPRPKPFELGRYYPDDYMPFQGAIEDESKIWRRLDRRFGVNKRCRAVRKRAGPKGRILDVGCATGIFLDGMRSYGWEVYGLEINPRAAAYARERFNLNVVTGELKENTFPLGYFDVITLWDVLEHVYNPRETLSHIARMVRPGGWLVLSLPNPESWAARFLGRYWIGWDLPRHLHLFNRHVLKQLLEETGFRLREITSFTGRYHALIMSIEFYLGERLSSKVLQRTIMGLLRSWPARLLALPVYWITDKIHPSSIITVFSQRQMKTSGEGTPIAENS